MVNGLYKKGELVQWERAWEVLVHTGLIFKIIDNRNYESRIKEAGQRIIERVRAILNKIDSSRSSNIGNSKMLSNHKLIGDSQNQGSNIS